MWRNICVVSLFLSACMVSSKPIELCKLSKEWGDRAYEKKENCKVVDLKLKAATFTIGGFSSGAIMTTNLFTMFNEHVDGAIVSAGLGPCANQGYSCNVTDMPSNYSVASMWDKPVFFYHGISDPVVLHEWTVQSANWFEEQKAKIKRIFIHDFLHIFPNSVSTNYKYNPPLSCGKKNATYSSIQNCGYNMAFEALQHIYGSNLVKDTKYQNQGQLWAIDQKPFNIEGAKLADQGFLFVPTVCLTGPCRFHVDFHGCTDSIVKYNDTYMRQLGYLEYAVKNKIIMLFPQNNDTDPSLYKDYCWASAQQAAIDHPQIVGISKLVEAIFNKDLFNEGVGQEFKGMALSDDPQPDLAQRVLKGLKNRLKSIRSWISF